MAKDCLAERWNSNMPWDWLALLVMADVLLI